MNFKNISQNSCGDFDSISNLSQHLSHDLSFKEKTSNCSETFEAGDLPKSFNMSSLYTQACSDQANFPHNSVENENYHRTANSYFSGKDFPLQGFRDLKYPCPVNSKFAHHSLLYSSVEMPSYPFYSDISSEFLSNTFRFRMNNKYYESAFLDCKHGRTNGGEQDTDLNYLKFDDISNKSFNSLDNLADANNDMNNVKFWDQLQSQWELLGKHDVDSHSWLIHRDIIEKEIVYNFSTPRLDNNQCDIMQQGISMLSHGHLSSAVGLFEAELQNNPENTKAWLLLGTCHAENEEDELAIAALRRCIQLDASNLDARLLLSVSYANESKQRQACKILREWLLINPKFSNLFDKEPLESSDPSFIPSFLDPILHSKTVSLFQHALSSNISESNDKSDLLMGLGVLYHLSEEYPLSIDSFRSALSIQPDNPLLWNKLGATLANSDNCEEAIQAYNEALKLYPNYVRCRYNLGIACMNLKSFKEACQHFLIALKLQAQGRGPNTTAWNLWSTLRLALMLGDMPLYFPYVDNRDLNILLSEFNC